jgi:hypothetical protein
MVIENHSKFFQGAWRRLPAQWGLPLLDATRTAAGDRMRGRNAYSAPGTTVAVTRRRRGGRPSAHEMVTDHGAVVYGFTNSPPTPGANRPIGVAPFGSAIPTSTTKGLFRCPARCASTTNEGAPDPGTSPGFRMHPPSGDQHIRSVLQCEESAYLSAHHGIGVLVLPGHQRAHLQRRDPSSGDDQRRSRHLDRRGRSERAACSQ